MRRYPVPNTIPTFRVRLFNLGDKLSDAERKKRLQGQYRRISQLNSYIFWMDLGEAGYLDFKRRLKERKVAKQMANDQPHLFEGISPQRAQKMIAKAVEAQEKADEATRKARTPSRFRHSSGKSGPRNSPKRRSYQSNRQRSPRPQPRKHERSESKHSPRKRGSNNRS